MINHIIKQRFFGFVTSAAIISTLFMGLAGANVAQSTDIDNPTPMSVDAVQGRWSKDKLGSHYYSFTGGPGTVKILFDFTSEGAQLVAGQLSDADGRAFIPVENRSGDQEGKNFVQGIAQPEGLRLIATYEIKRRQKLVVRVYNWGVAYNAGIYKVRVTGDSVSFNP